jgi:peroxiredoxin Q/BCP
MSVTNAIPIVGDKAPAFSLPANDNTTVSLAGLKGKTVVLYFYPKDDTPGCTVEARGFRDYSDELAQAGAVVLGVSPDGIDSHCKFIAKYDLSFRLLADTDHAVAERYGVWVEKSMYGKSYMGIQRATFLIDSNGKIHRTWPKVKPEGHAEEVLEAVKALA